MFVEPIKVFSTFFRRIDDIILIAFCDTGLFNQCIAAILGVHRPSVHGYIIFFPIFLGPAIPYNRDYRRKYDYIKSQLKKPSNVPNKYEIKIRRQHILEDSFRQIQVRGRDFELRVAHEPVPNARDDMTFKCIIAKLDKSCCKIHIYLNQFLIILIYLSVGVFILKEF